MPASPGCSSPRRGSSHPDAMATALRPSDAFAPPSGLVTAGFSTAAGLAVTGLIFAAIAFAPKHQEEVVQTEFEELHAVTLPVLPPPPPPASDTAPRMPSGDIVLLAEERTGSSVKLPAAPILAEPPVQIAAMPRFDFAPSAFKPAALAPEMEGRRTYEKSEVDQPPVVVYKVAPDVNKFLAKKIKKLSATFVFVVTPEGNVTSIRLVDSCDVPELDALCLEALRDWKFTPAVRKGRTVRCWVNQRILFKLPEKSRFSAD